MVVWIHNTSSVDINTNALEEYLSLLDIDEKKEENRKETDTQNKIIFTESTLKNVNEVLN